MNIFNKFILILILIVLILTFSACPDASLNKNWNEFVDDIFTIRYPDNSIIYDNPLEWLIPRKEAFYYSCNYLGVNWTYGQIYIYVFNDREQGKKYGEEQLGHANTKINSIYTLYNQSYGHELTHLVAYRINNGKIIRSQLINEGLSTHLDNINNGNRYHQLAKNLMEEGELEKRNLLNEGFRNCKKGYPLGASFVKYLIDTYGLELFKEFFSQNNYYEKKSFMIYYNQSYSELYEDWILYLTNNKFTQ